MALTATSFDEAAVDAHLQQFLGKARTVFHAIASPMAPHVYFYAANGRRQWHTLVTAGLSGFRMPAPPDAPHAARAELMLYLPETWSPPQDPGSPEMWPVTLLRSLVAYAIEQNAFLGNLHTVPNLTSTPFGGPYKPGSALTNVVLLPPIREAKALDHVVIRGETVRFLNVVPITTAECDAKVKRGFREALAPLLDKGVIPAVTDIDRKDVASA